ncbi:MAG: iron ABC transporter permease [Crocinitomicaceae bacterium]|nr:iron ABC transporter permease [Crocinitomicaceae bacterium]MDG2465062.1 iron ABC transporter permease [Crocinitomicaceae bacterium]
MISQKRNRFLLLLLLVIMPIAFISHFAAGEISISWSTFGDAWISFDSSNPEHIIVREFRFPRFIMACLAGSALSVCGLMMQTLFNNPLAGPYILGINSGSSLFVAISLMTGLSIFQSDFGLVSSALIGAFIFGLIILSISFKVKQGVSLLLIGLMLGSFSSALVSVIQYLSEANSLKMFTMWIMGSLQLVESDQLPFISVLFLFGMLGSFLIIKPLNAFVLGETEAVLLGISIRKIRLLIIVFTALLTGLITAYCGPIAFIGLAVPNLVKIIFKTQDHRILLPASLIGGAIFIVLCDIIVQLTAQWIPLPINAVTSLIGAPMVIYFIVKRLAQ